MPRANDAKMQVKGIRKIHELTMDIILKTATESQKKLAETS